MEIQRKLIFTPDIITEASRFISENKDKKLTIVLDIEAPNKRAHILHLERDIQGTLTVPSDIFVADFDIRHRSKLREFFTNLEDNITKGEGTDILLLIGDLGLVTHANHICEDTNTDFYIISESVLQYFNVQESSLFNE